VIHHERDVREEQHHTYMWREQAIIEWSWRVISGDTNDVNDWTLTIAYAKSDHGMWTLLLLATTVRSFAHMPLGICDRNTSKVSQISGKVHWETLRLQAVAWHESYKYCKQC